MVTIESYLVAILLMLSSSICAQDLSAVVTDVNKANSEKEYVTVRNELERLCIQSPGEWLPHYYMAYVDVQLSFRTQSREARLKYINDAENYLKKLADKPDADASEVYTLKGYRLYALVAFDPQTNGPKYFGEVTQNYQKALELNPNNPRAIMLRAMFNNDMAKFMHRSYESFEAEISKAATLFTRNNEQPNHPSWGKEWFDNRLTVK
ncbi:hypothetical protein [uncultured Bacteroides sp.]|uniref:hypothetical protein n=1 Tax=uncultured Bacteroides sp. TaxID=162156 RepID=UPI002AABCAEB|nr:hypothetical protein [uncultured Bacteroides sp.]